MEITKAQSLSMRRKLSRKNRAYHVNRKKMTWNQLNELITTYVAAHCIGAEVKARYVRYTHIRVLMRMGYEVIAHPTKPGYILIKWDT